MGITHIYRDILTFFLVMLLLQIFCLVMWFLYIVLMHSLHVCTAECLCCSLLTLPLLPMVFVWFQVPWPVLWILPFWLQFKKEITITAFKTWKGTLVQVHVVWQGKQPHPFCMLFIFIAKVLFPSEKTVATWLLPALLITCCLFKKNKNTYTQSVMSL